MMRICTYMNALLMIMIVVMINKLQPNAHDVYMLDITKLLFPGLVNLLVDAVHHIIQYVS
jgi:hypothetical protein